jgi:hypothetical protein
MIRCEKTDAGDEQNNGDDGGMEKEAVTTQLAKIIISGNVQWRGPKGKIQFTS